MKHYQNNNSMLDLLFNLLLGFVMLFVIAFILIQPVDPPKQDVPLDEQVIIKLEWSKHVDIDLDLWVKDSQDQTTFFKNKDNTSIALERDDLGYLKEHVVVNGEGVTTNKNYEVVRIRKLLDGTYYVSVHFYSNRKQATITKSEFTITMFNAKSHQEIGIFTGVVEYDKELPVLKFDVSNGELDIDSLKKSYQEILLRATNTPRGVF